MKKIIRVTKPELPPLRLIISTLTTIWQTKNLTNNGPFHQKFEKELSLFLGVPYVSVVTNATIGLLIAIKNLELSGEVITTPYAFVATAHVLAWCNIKPIFVDIDPLDLNINPDKIERAITSKTTGILAMHCYGNPCQSEQIERIAEKYNLKVIYDAAHAFGVNKNGASVLRFGHLSVLSFHATKVFNTMEGGAIICHDPKTKRKIDLMKNFGFENETTVSTIGINGKMNELQAALGSFQLKYVDRYIKKRRQIAAIYESAISKIEGLKTVLSSHNNDLNFSYYPILVEKNYTMSRDELYDKFVANNIFCRKYFYPIIPEYSIYKSLFPSDHWDLPEARLAANKIICLPIYPDLKKREIKKVIKTLA
jgi:dTDP-4-amino-4,6-dideoxygalactose transaminase